VCVCAVCVCVLAWTLPPPARWSTQRIVGALPARLLAFAPLTREGCCASSWEHTRETRLSVLDCEKQLLGVHYLSLSLFVHLHRPRSQPCLARASLSAVIDVKGAWQSSFQRMSHRDDMVDLASVVLGHCPSFTVKPESWTQHSWACWLSPSSQLTTSCSASVRLHRRASTCSTCLHSHATADISLGSVALLCVVGCQ
jgi:hypothetical protein